MSTDIALYVERLAKGGVWEEVARRHALIQRRARSIFPSGKLTDERLRVAETNIMLADGPIPGWRSSRVDYWPVEQDYRLFSRLSGMRLKEDYPPIAPARGFPPDGCPALRSMYAHHAFSSARYSVSRTASWLTLAEMDPLRRQFPRFREDVLDLMAFISPDRTRIRAVFWYD